MSARDTIALIGNPVAGRRALQNIGKAEELLSGQGAHVRVMLTSRRGDAERYAQQLTEERPLKVIVAGGDGTYNEVANGLAHSDIPMAILPLGTTSVLAHEIGLSVNLKEAVALALRGAPRRISLGRITFPAHKEPRSRHFLLMAGIGFDGETCFGISTTLKKRVGKLAYILSGFRVLLRYNPSLLHITGRGVSLIDQGVGIGEMNRRLRELPSPRSLTFTGYALVAGKAACYGGPQKITSHARLEEPALHVFVFHGRGRVALTRLAVGILLNRHLTFRDVSYLVAQDIEVTGSAHVQIDGDYAGVAPVMIEVVPDALSLIMDIQR